MSALRLQDLRLAFRRLRKDPGTTIAAVAALAFAIGASLATSSLLSAVLLNPLPVADPERLFQIDFTTASFDRGSAPTHSFPVFEAIRDSGTFDGVAAGGPSLGPVLVTENGMPQGRQIYFADHDFFATLGISVARGRSFTSDDDRRGAPVVALLSDRYWRTVFNADPDVLGRSVALGGTYATVVGVLPPGFRGMHLSEAPDLYLPLNIVGDIDSDLARFSPYASGLTWLRLVGRLWPDQTVVAATARLNALDCACGRQATHGEVRPLSLTSVNVAAVPGFARAGTIQFTTLLSITVALLLLVGCLTVGMLLLVRTQDRRDEIAVRLALGATRIRLALSVVGEAIILCALGAMLAVPVALWLSYGIRGFQLPGRVDVQRLELTVAPEAWLGVTGVALAVALLIALLASIAGAAPSARSSRAHALAFQRVAHGAPRTAIVVSQIAITLVLVTGAGLFARSLVEALSLNPGVSTERIATGYLALGRYGYTPERTAVFVDELIERLRQSRAIESVATTQSLSSIVAGVPINIDGMPVELPSGILYQAVDADYFSTIGLPIVRGRGLAGSDAANVAIVSESLGKFIAGDGEPVGHLIADGTSFRRVARGEAAQYLDVVGVVPDLITNVGTTKPLAVYQSTAPRTPSVGLELVLRAAGDANLAIRETIEAVRAIDQRVSMESLMTLDEQIARQMNSQHFGVYVLGALGGIALLQTVLGTYVVAQSMVVRRRRELGIRAALGARGEQLRSLVLRDTARVVGLGLLAGLALALFGARLIRSLLYRVEPLDPLVLIGAAVGILGLALLVSVRPALEASRVDLSRSLREE